MIVEKKTANWELVVACIVEEWEAARSENEA